ncbi:MAG: hypothetical protein WC840_07630, partial [Candidatus Peribacteraceae bacterium]
RSSTYNPPYYPPYTPPYYPPYNYPNQPVYYPPTTNPPVYYPPVTMPRTGTRGTQLYSKPHDETNVTAAASQSAPPPSQTNAYATVFYATLVTLLAVGSAAASRLASGLF